MQCLTLAIENPPKAGEYRVFNQFEEVYDVTELALKVQKVAVSMGLDVTIRNLDNPRIEQEQHYYEPDHQHLLDLGYKVITSARSMSPDRVRAWPPETFTAWPGSNSPHYSKNTPALNEKSLLFFDEAG